MIHQVRVIVGDTDHMGIVYYANYLRYFEAARAGYLRALGKTQKELEGWDIALPVIEVHCHYRRSARNEELLDVYTDLDDIRGASFRFVYEIKRGEELLADGFTRHACTSTAGRPKRISKEFRELISKAL